MDAVVTEKDTILAIIELKSSGKTDDDSNHKVKNVRKLKH